MSDVNPTAPLDIEFTLQEAEAVYDELATLQFALDDDPLRFGPKRLNNKTAEAHRMFERCSRLLLSLSRRLHIATREHRKCTTAFDMSRKTFLASDPETRAGRSTADRDAIASMKLAPLILQINHLDQVIQDLTMVITMVKAKANALKADESRLREQIKLCRSELDIGAHWGSAIPASEVEYDITRSPLVGPELERHAAVMEALTQALPEESPCLTLDEEDEAGDLSDTIRGAPEATRALFAALPPDPEADLLVAGLLASGGVTAPQVPEVKAVVKVATLDFDDLTDLFEGTSAPQTNGAVGGADDFLSELNPPEPKNVAAIPVVKPQVANSTYVSDDVDLNDLFSSLLD